MAEAAPVATIFKEVEGVLDVSQLETTPQLKTKLIALKSKLGVKIIQTKCGFNIRGAIGSVVEFEKAFQEHAAEDLKQDILICCQKGANLEQVYSFFEKKPWGSILESVTSSSNIPFNQGKLCYFLLDKREQILEVLADNNARMRLKEFTQDGVRLKVEKSKKGSNLEDEMIDFHEMSTKGMESFDIQISNLKAPQQFLNRIMKQVKPVLLFLRILNKDTFTYCLSTLLLKSQIEEARKKVEKVMHAFCDTPSDVSNLLLALCDDRFEDPIEVEDGSGQTQLDSAEDNQKTTSAESNSIHGTEGGGTSPMVEEKEVVIGDQDVINYMLQFQKMRIHKIEKDLGIDVGLERKDEGVLLIRAKPSNVEQGDLEMSRLAQGIYQLRTETINVSKLDQAKFEHNKKEAFKQAKGKGFLVRMEGESNVFVMGPGEHLDECVKTVKIALGIASSRRRVLAKTLSSPTPLPSTESPTAGGATKPRYTGRSHALSPTAYATNDGNINIFAWKADITKLHVDVIVNAANERLDHGAGVAGAISKAAGNELDKESREYVKTYGNLKTADVCLTTAGKMPCKKVMHTVGPIWNTHRNITESESLLLHAFYNCLDRAQSNGYTSIALPAISSGIYGAPKEAVASLAMKAVVAFCHKYPFSKVKDIHLVDIVPDTVVSFQYELNMLVHKKILIENTHYTDFNKWYGDKSKSTTKHSSNDISQQRNSLSRESSVDAKWTQQSHYSQSSYDSAPSMSLQHHGGQKVPVKDKDVIPRSRGATSNEVEEESMDGYINDSAADGKTATARSKENGVEPSGANTPRGFRRPSYSDAVKKNHETPQDGMAGVHGAKEKPEQGTTPKESSQSKGTTKEEDTCSICMDVLTNPFTLHKCKHTFCKGCIDACFEKLQPKCPNCCIIYGKLKGNQPQNGQMTVYRNTSLLPGYGGCGTITIHYFFPNGKQGENHPHPGKQYFGTRRTAYLPDNHEGNKVLRLLKEAFGAQMVFTVGQSSTTGLDDCVIWNCIHHKTNVHGGPQRYGYPDPTYLNRVQEELAAQGFK